MFFRRNSDSQMISSPLEKNGPYAYVRFNGHFAGEPGLAGIFIEAKDGSGGGDNVKL